MNKPLIYTVRVQGAGREIILPCADKSDAFFNAGRIGGTVYAADPNTGKMWRYAGDGQREQWQEVPA